MRSKDLSFIIILIISGEIYAEEKPCGLPRVENGKIALYYYTFGSFYFPMKVDQKLSFSCLAGYTTETGKQEGKATCTTEGWAPEPRCLKKCTKPDLVNGFISDAKLLYKFQENMRYSCASGYKTRGGQDEEVVQCLADGWSSPPACRKEHETCLAPELYHGNYSTTQRTFKVKDKVRYECAPGYSTAGGQRTEEAECHTYGWSLAPECTKLKCTSLRLIENGYFQPTKQTYEEGDVVQFFCHENYYLSGSDLIQCYNFGWYPEPPVCEENNENCNAPPDVSNGAVVGGLLASYPAGASVEYRCDEYYLLKGAQKSQCEQGRWSPPPVCLEPCTIDEKYMAGNHVELKWRLDGRFLHGDLIDFVCKQGFDLSPSTPQSELSVQCDRGKVKYPLCLRKESKGICASPPLISNGVIISSTGSTYENGSSVEYKCFDHYFLQGSRESYCLQGMWTPPPVCLEPCTLSFDEMENSNLLLKWNFDNRPYILHGEYIHFICKRDTYMIELSIIRSEFSVQCDRGQLKYPRCIQRERILSYQEPLRT
ncbi:coagulation factor XIII B chain isoform X3 [Rousettus aegyptiacus]|uniref:coagulation factor XIII B chain isoform X3 n=1 Tax=Rousettus aegyptiacus TaxID=9407 RepID=UPI00168CC9CD|nr:coagulation factor XIII B chain isoform X3 [Rousettus aegyptiacus]